MNNELDQWTIETLSDIAIATLTAVLLRKGLRNVWLRGSKPLRPGRARVAGPAFTVRFVPAREDLATPASWSSPVSTRSAVESMPPGCVTVVDAMGVEDAGIFGNILCQRMKVRGVAGLITDGAVRDLAGVLQTDLPVWCKGAAAPPSIAGLTFVNWQDPIGCGGVAVYPSDAIVADEDGAVVIPRALLDDVVEEAAEQEKLEAWILGEVHAGKGLPGLYLPNAETKARYEAFRKVTSKLPSR
jgi:regulator of RNase E activity RraA